MTVRLTVSGLVADAFATVSAQLPALLRLGRGPFVAALLLGLVFGGLAGFDAAPVATLAAGFAYAWFSFHVLRLVLLGPARAVLPAPAGRDAGGRLIRRSILGTYMGRAVGLAALGLGGVMVMLLVVVWPLTVLPLTLAERQASLGPHGFLVVGNLVFAAALAAVPFGIPLARLLPLLAATATDRDTGFAATWLASRGHGRRLATALVVIATPFVFAWLALNAALAILAGPPGDPGPVAGLLALVLATAMGLTLSALVAVAIARVWSAISVTPAAVPTTLDMPRPGDTKERMP